SHLCRHVCCLLHALPLFPTRRSSDLRNDFSTKFLSYYRVVSSCTTSNFYTFNIFQCVQATTFFRNQSKVRVDVWSRETKFSLSFLSNCNVVQNNIIFASIYTFN